MFGVAAVRQDKVLVLLPKNEFCLAEEFCCPGLQSDPPIFRSESESLPRAITRSDEHS